MAHLSNLDWGVVILFLAFFVFLGIYFRSKSSGGLSAFFLGGRNLPWYIAGVSMVATTFAADTPLWVTEKIAQHGVSGNWLWWNMLIGGMLTTFFFARLWRRANILTELELLEIRYSGKIAAVLRGTKAVYLGLFLNVIIIGWVNAAMISIFEVFFDLSYNDAFWLVGACMVLVAVYSSIAGLLGIAITDFVQFIIAMGGCVILAIIVLNSEKVGGMTGLQAQLPEWRFNILPRIGGASDLATGTFALTAGAFFSYLFVQWWASWYPGAEPGGGGYISQRMMSAKDEKNAVYASLFFNIAHYCLRPWPWIIVGLCALVLYPDLPIEESKKGFVYIMRDYLPSGVKGLLLVGFISAYMSTISTQLNWGASYLTNDLYKRFIFKATNDEAKDDQKLVKIAKLFTVLLMLIGLAVSSQITTIDSAAQFLIASGAGLGMVLILRWYWWRINAWSEFVATVAPIFGLLIANYILAPRFGESFSTQNGPFLFTVVFSTIAWLTVTFMSKPTDSKVLKAFYERVKPSGWWGVYAQKESSSKSLMLYQLAAWFSGVIMVYSVLFFIGYALFGWWTLFTIWLIIGILSFISLRWSMNKAGF